MTSKILDSLSRHRASAAAFLAFVTAVTGFAVLFRDNPRLVEIVIVLVSLAAAGVACGCVAFSHTESRIAGGGKVPTFPRGRPWAFAGMIAASLGMVAVFAVPRSRALLVPSLDPSIESVRIARSSSDYRIELTINNPLETPLLLSSVKVDGSMSDPNVSCCCGEVGDYKITESVAYTKLGEGVGDLALWVTSLTGGLIGYASPARGHLVSFCGNYRISIIFPVSAELAPRKRSAFFIQFPRTFIVVANDSSGGRLNPAKERLDLNPVEVNFPDPDASALDPGETSRLALQLVTNGGEHLDRVLEFSGGEVRWPAAVPNVGATQNAGGSPDGK